MTEDGPGSMIVYSRHKNHYVCSKHGPINGDRKSVCSECEELPAEERPAKPPKSVLEEVQFRVPIGVFWNDLQEFIDTRHRQHRWTMGAHGKTHCKAHREPEKLFSDDGFSVHLLRDYSDRLPCVFDGTPMSRDMGGGVDVGMEGILLFTRNNDGDITRHWVSFLSNEKRQDARTSYINSRKLIDDFQQNHGCLRRNKGDVLHMRSDGCSKQYKCANAIKLNTILSNEFAIEIDVMINCAMHGKDQVDAMSGVDKAHLRNGFIDGISSIQRGEDGIAKSESEKCRDFLSDPKRSEGDIKHKPKLDGTDVETRWYDTTDFDDKKKIPIENCTYRIKGGRPQGVAGGADFQPKKGTPEASKNGIHEMMHFRYHPLLPKNVAACRRIACLCKACRNQLALPWDRNQPDHRLQPKFQSAPDCYFKGPMEDLNVWYFLEVEPATKTDENGNSIPVIEEAEVTEIFHAALTSLAREVCTTIEEGGFGAINADEREAADGFHLAQWKGLPHLLQEPAVVEGCLKVMPPGTLVCEGIYWDRITGDRGWCEPPKNDYQEKPKRHLFFMNHALHGHLIPEDAQPSRDKMPRSRLSHHNRKKIHMTKYIPAWRREELNVESETREQLEYTPAGHIVEATAEQLEEENETGGVDINDLDCDSLHE